MTHVPWLEPAPRAPAMLGTVTLAIVMLSTATKFDSARTIPAVQSIPPSSEGGPLESMAACVIGGSSKLTEVGSGIAAQVDLGIHGQPDAQRMGGELIRIQADAHRQALYNFDPVARGVLRRDQGESRTRAAIEAFDDAVVDHLAVIQVALKLDALSGVNLGELHFLEVSVDIHLIDRHDGQQRHGGLHALAELDLPARNHPIDGCADHRA